MVAVGLAIFVIGAWGWHEERPHVVRARLQRQKESSWERRHVVTVSEAGVQLVDPEGTESSIKWEELRCVRVITNDSGPLFCDFWWVLEDSSGSLSVPQGSRGEDALIERLFALPGWDAEKGLEALTSIENAEFLCWESST
jgi:hypothetical protein